MSYTSIMTIFFIFLALFIMLGEDIFDIIRKSNSDLVKVNYTKMIVYKKEYNPLLFFIGIGKCRGTYKIYLKCTNDDKKWFILYNMQDFQRYSERDIVMVKESVYEGNNGKLFVYTKFISLDEFNEAKEYKNEFSSDKYINDTDYRNNIDDAIYQHYIDKDNNKTHESAIVIPFLFLAMVLIHFIYF